MTIDLDVSLVSPGEVMPSPLNPRKRFLQARLVEMAESISRHGVLQPLRCRPGVDGMLEVVWGERRLRWALLVMKGYEDAEGNTHAPVPDLRIPVMVGEMSDEAVFEVMMVENLEREALSPSEEAHGYARMMEDFNLSMQQVADRLKVSVSRVFSRLPLLDLPNATLARVDDGELPLYVAQEALRVPAEWGAGETRMEALKLAEEAGSPQRARELIEARYLRPAREASKWMLPDNVDRLRGVYGEAVEVLPYRECREIFPSGVSALTPVTAGQYVLGSDVPSMPVVHFPVELTWEEMAALFGSPRYVACDGNMRDVVLCRRDLVAEAARTAHTQEITVAREGEGWTLSAEEVFLNVGDKVSLAKISHGGHLPQGFVGGRIYVVASVVNGPEGGQLFSLADGPGGALLPVHGDVEKGCRLALLDVTRCPFLPLEGRVATEAVRQEVAESISKEEAETRARAAEVSALVAEVEMAIRAECARERGCDVLLAKGVQFLAVAGAVGFSHDEHPGNRLMVALERPEDEGGLFSNWDGMGESRAGAESFAVCAWLLYWLDQWDGDLAKCPQYREAASGYGV